MLRAGVVCPICHRQGCCRIVAWRRGAIRMECAACGLRFSLARNLIERSIERALLIEAEAGP